MTGRGRRRAPGPARGGNRRSPSGRCLARSLLAALVAAGAASVPRGAQATPTAAIAAAGSTRPHVFALIVTNNRSATLERPDLKYADDDGARYHALFRGLAAREDVVLLTRFDESSARAYPELQAGLAPPKLGAVRSALAALRARVEAARRAGERAAFYFVFAGHGDVDRGKGFLELEDGRLDADFLEHEVVEGVPADVQHIILDSCNSFFVINPRSPGGRRWATPQDLTSGFSQRHPQVGLLLSTNAEAEVYEWSQLGAGIFSYEVRAGLAGAADVDGDGVVRYDELGGYLESANHDVPNDDLRPRILARGPFGRGDADLFASGALGGQSLVVGPGERHIWIRGARGERVLDVHKEKGGAVKVTLPGGAGPFSVYEQTAADPGGRPVMTELLIPPERPSVTLAELVPAHSSFGSRGGEAIFGRLYGQAWGPDAFAVYLRDGVAKKSDAIYGVARKDEGPVRRYLQRIAALGSKGVEATGDLAAAMLPESVMEPLRAHAPAWMGSTAGGADASVHARAAIAPPLPVAARPDPWDGGRVPSGDNAFTLARHDVRLSLFGRSAVSLTARTELSTVLALDLSLFPNLSLKHRFAESEHVAAAWKLAAGGGFYEVALAGASPFPVLVGFSGYAFGAYQLAELQLSVKPFRPLTFTWRAGAAAAQVRAHDLGFAGAGDALAVRTDGGSNAFGLAGGFETDVVLSGADALILDGSGYLYQRSDEVLLSAMLAWTHAWAHVHFSLGALAVLDMARRDGAGSLHRFLPYANIDWTF